MTANLRSEVRNLKSPWVANPTPCGRTRREALWQIGGGFASLALVDLLGRDGFFGNSAMADESDIGARSDAGQGLV